ncbi:MAG: hypothetical protein Q8O88_05600 [bacterium]|nr:hypothetical protein [bacterium]
MVTSYDFTGYYFGGILFGEGDIVMIAEDDPVREFVGRDLVGFRIEELSEVFRVNEDGFRVITIGYFRDNNTAEAFIQTHTLSNYLRMQGVLVLINDNQTAFLLGESVKVVSDREILAEIRARIIARLPPEQLKILGLI